MRPTNPDVNRSNAYESGYTSSFALDTILRSAFLARDRETIRDLQRDVQELNSRFQGLSLVGKFFYLAGRLEAKIEEKITPRALHRIHTYGFHNYSTH